MHTLTADRRSFLLASAAAGLSLGPPAAWAEDPDPERTAAEVVTPGTAKAIDRGLTYLAGKQTEDGSFGSGCPNVAVCSLAGLAFLSGGHTPGRGPYGRNVQRLLDFVLAQSQESGFISEPSSSSHGPMYGHGFATLFLAECYGMSSRAELRERLSRAVKLIVNTQNKEGGWRYQPQRRDADISVTVAQVMALRAARNAGLYVPRDTIDRSIEYVKRCQNDDGGFKYMLSAGGDSQFPRSAAGVVALFSAGIYEGAEIRKGLAYLMRFLPRAANVGREGHYFYGQYYAVQAMWHSGGDYWTKWYPAIRDALLPRQADDGSWADAICAEYGTSMALIVLEMPNNLLPIFQR